MTFLDVVLESRVSDGVLSLLRVQVFVSIVCSWSTFNRDALVLLFMYGLTWYLFLLLSDIWY